MHPSNSSRAVGVAVFTTVAAVATGLACGGNTLPPPDGTSGPEFSVQRFTNPNPGAAGFEGDGGFDAGLFPPIPGFDAGNPSEALDAGFPLEGDAGTGPVRPIPGPVAGSFDAGTPAQPLRGDEPEDAGTRDAGEELGLISPTRFLEDHRPTGTCPRPDRTRVRYVSTLDPKPLDVFVEAPGSCLEPLAPAPRPSKALAKKPSR